MIIARTVAELRDALQPARTGTIGFVPTMGALHEGHVSLLAAASENDTVVLSVFVNPTQFDDPADLAAYPRVEEADLARAEQAGVDIVFAPAPAEMYPTGFATTVSVSGHVAESFEGAVRGRSHFDGVATIVVKLLMAVLPDAAYFGWKDAQQVAVIRRVAADLDLPVRIVACPTSRDADGLARSSRNARLSAAERSRAVALPRALEALAAAHASGTTDTTSLRATALAELTAAHIEPEYLAFVDPVWFDERNAIDGPTLVIAAARIGTVRLLDNILLDATRPERARLDTAVLDHGAPQ